MSLSEFCAMPYLAATGFHTCTNATLAASASRLALYAAM
jgi:hypothetical protein